MDGPSQVATPSMSRVRQLVLENNQTPNSPSISFYSNISYDPEEHQLSYEEAIQQILNLTNELKEFERSSKELEDAMELELEELNKEKDELSKKLRKKDDDLNQQKLRMISMEKELSSLMGKNSELVVRLETELNSKNKKLINVEIQNDNFENNERIISSKLRTLEENYNEAIERTVIAQGEINELAQMYNKEKLSNSNKDNIITDLNNKISTLELENERLKVIISKPEKLSRFKTPAITADLKDDADILPPSASYNFPKSSSMKQIHQMNEKTNQLSQKADTLRQKIEDLNQHQQHHKKKSRLTRFGSRSEPKAASSSYDKENRNPTRAVSESATHNSRNRKLLFDSTNTALEMASGKEATQKKGSRFFMALKKSMS